MVGQSMATVILVVTAIKDTLAELSVGPEIVDWIIGKGNDFFKRWLKTLAEEYKKSLPPPALTPEPKIEHVINFDSAAFCPSGLTVAPEIDQIASRVRGVRKLEDLKVQTHLDVGQKGGSQGVKGYDLKQKLEGKNVLGAQILDFYLEHLDLIPEDWKTKGWIFFWGTLYCAGDGRLYVRYLRWDRTSWISVYRRLDNVWYDDDPAAVSASTQRISHLGF